MSASKAILQVNKDLYIGKGMHKIVYRHPIDSNKCIKILHGTPDDLEREFKYRKIRAQKGIDSKIIPQYFGKVATNEGDAFVFELITNYDGSISKNLRSYLSEQTRIDDSFMKKLIDALTTLRKYWKEERLITSDWDPVNLLVQEISKDKIRIVVVDNIGSAVLIPLVLYIDFMAVSHANRHWERFIRRVNSEFPNIITQDILNSLL